MSEKRVRIRLATEGKAEVVNDFAEIEQRGEAAGDGIGKGFQRGADDAQAAVDRINAVLGSDLVPDDAVAEALGRQLATIEQEAEKTGRQLAALFGQAFDPADLPDIEDMLRRQAAGFEEAGEGATNYDRMLAQLQNRYDPLAAITREYGEALENIARLQAAGIIDLEEAQNLTQLATAAVEEQVIALERGAVSAGQMREGWRSLSSQLSDAVRAIISGQNPLEVLARRANDTGGAVVRLTGGASTFARIMTGPWGLAITAGTALLGGLIGRLLESRRASDGAAEAKNRHRAAAEDLTKAIQDLEEATSRATQTTWDSTVADYARARSLRERAQAAREAIVEELRLARSRYLGAEAASVDPTLAGEGGFNPGAAATARFAREIEQLNTQLEEAEANLDSVNASVRRVEGQIGAQGVAEGMDASARATGRYERALSSLNQQLERGEISQATFNQRLSDAAIARDAALAAARGQRGAGGRGGSGRSSGDRDAEREARELQRLLEGLEQRFDPAAAGARRLREEMDAIARVAAAGLIDPETAAWFRDLAQMPENLGEKGAQAAKEAADEAQRRAEAIARISDDMDDQATLAMHELSVVRLGADAREASVRLVAIELDLRRQLPGATEEDIAGLMDKARALEAINRRLREQERHWEEIVGTGSAFIDNVLNPQNWRSWGDLGRAVLNDLMQDFIRLAAANPLKNMLFGAGLPTLGGLFGGRLGGSSEFNFLDSASRLAPGAFALGTHNSPAGLALVGEFGPELLNLPGGSKITPAGETRRMLAANDAGIGAISMPVSIYAPGADAAALARVEAKVDQLRADLPAMAVAANQEARKRFMVR